MTSTGKIVYDMPFAEYQKADGINASVLKIVSQQSLAHAKAAMDGIDNDESQFEFGASFHSLLLEGHQDFVIHPPTYPAPIDHAKVKKGELKEGDPLEWNWNATICKQWASKHDGVTILSEIEAVQINSMVEGVRGKSEIKGLLNGKREVSLFVEKNGVKLKARIDLLPDIGPVIDFKSTISARPENFVRQSLNLGYHIQAAFYLDMLSWCNIERDSFWFVAVEKAAPFASAIVKFNDVPISFVHLGRQKYRTALKQILEAQKTGSWPSYESVEAELHAPIWMLKELESVA